MEENQTQEQSQEVKAAREALIKDFISLVRIFCGEEMRRNAHRPLDHQRHIGDFITTFESDLVNQLKNLTR